VIALEAVELLKNLNPDQLARIASIAKEVSLPPHSKIIEPSTAPDALYIVLDGAIELRGGEGATTIARQNDVIGAWALFDPDPLSVSAVTVEASKLLRIGRDDFYDLLSDNMEITASIFATLVRRFRRMVGGAAS
jgi:CRP-like cAMP-binding protein